VAQLFSLGIIEHAMRFTLSILALSLLLTACSRRDAKLDRQVAGVWNRESTSNTMTYASDGSFSIIVRKPSHTNSYAGTWQIRDQVLIMTYTNAPVVKGRSLVGGIERYSIIHADDHQLICNEDGQTVTLTR